MNQRVQRIQAMLEQGLQPLACEVEDESALHAGHAGAASGGGHYRVRIVAPAFAGKARLARHRLVYDCLHDLMQADIHALAIIALAPSEVPGGTP
ncbi:BolA family transcriptional regulator [Lacisediminimonas sp.]|uniref:BolA family protein n=1 Tax=Lacisediminimonas sp. TaxID=3060582 RepID=UPI0027213DBC|nr:BolA family protein [Lacisediminimonas sp.]MDO8300985.1 BolA family protein [Lacisediminimonas sp.]MDO9216122.1 BolA family protein [Lacisediminimonas sp.]